MMSSLFCSCVGMDFSGVIISGGSSDSVTGNKLSRELAAQLSSAFAVISSFLFHASISLFHL